MKLLSLAVALLRRGGVASSTSTSIVRTIHSKSVIPRGRAGIRLSQGRRKRLTTSQILKALASKRKWPYHDEGNAQPIDTEEQQLRKAAADWPSWLPKPLAYREAERRQIIEEEQEQTRKAAKSHSKPPTVEAIFIPKSSPEHSSRRKQPGETSSASWFSSKKREFSTSKASYLSLVRHKDQEQQEWPSQLPSESNSATSHPVWHTVRRGCQRADDFGHRHISKHSGFNWAVYTVVVTFGGIGMYLSMHRETVPFTGRRRWMSCSDATIEEAAQRALRGVAAQYKDKILPPDHPYSRRAVAIAGRVIAAARDLEGLEFKDGGDGGGGAAGFFGRSRHDCARELVNSTKWGCLVVDEPEANASMTPGGLIIVKAGLFVLMDAQVQVDGAHDYGTSEGADDRIATSIAHEVAHHLCQHIREQLSIVELQRQLSKVWAFIGFPVDNTAMNHIVFELPLSRTREHEADALGLKLMSRACFDPREAPHFWKRMVWLQQRDKAVSASREEECSHRKNSPQEVARRGRVDPSFFSTHPAAPERIQRLRGSLAAALEIRRRSGCPDIKAVGDFRRAAVKTAQSVKGTPVTGTWTMSTEHQLPSKRV